MYVIGEMGSMNFWQTAQTSLPGLWMYGEVVSVNLIECCRKCQVQLQSVSQKTLNSVLSTMTDKAMIIQKKLATEN